MLRLSRQLLNCVAADRPTDFDIQPDGATPTRLVTSFHEKPFTNIKKKTRTKQTLKRMGIHSTSDSRKTSYRKNPKIICGTIK